MTTPQTPTLDNQLCFALYSASNAVIRLYRPLLEPFDLTYPQFLVMLALWQADNVPLKALSQRTRLDPGTITPIVKRLEAKGLLTRQSDADDERVKRVALTDAGRAIQAPLFEAHRCLYESMNPDKAALESLRQQCLGLLDQINHRLGQ
ncbi:MarR family winged helix-turn-helix transcriptional regulator [Ferrimonas balearica]|uniref:MarR family winged helix-turn-helix transcriptional regulator n=1 Tax=Ferrimonas balearica TaxID=44012 RepID=UPI001C597371|nr:MarR family transcriptional regulator [Ferrimonas balearica]MBW3139749.1 MarR family transcriptional regulator [Ferrimonas balearica]MBY6107145.1 MarR family transcriptional regulator [Ferrimonas balearica]MBY6224299.1 MarR family transcriptional regulator [Ferrimonas balearica]